MPFHRGTHFLEDALESLKEQSFKDFEVLLICDHVEEDIDNYIDIRKIRLRLRILRT